MRAILRAASRHGKSSRGTPRPRRMPGTLHGAPRLAVLTTAHVLGFDSLQALGTLDLSLVCSPLIRAPTLLATASSVLNPFRRLRRRHRVFGLAGAHAGPD